MNRIYRWKRKYSIKARGEPAGGPSGRRLYGQQLRKRIAWSQRLCPSGIESERVAAVSLSGRSQSCKFCMPNIIIERSKDCNLIQAVEACGAEGSYLAPLAEDAEVPGPHHGCTRNRWFGRSPNIRNGDLVGNGR